MALFIDNNDNKMTFCSRILFICSHVVSFVAFALCAQAANDTTRAQINNIPEKSHFIVLYSCDRSWRSFHFFHISFHFTEMATHLKIVFVTCVLLFTLMEGFKPVQAKKGQQLNQRTKALENTLADLQQKINTLASCQGEHTHT